MTISATVIISRTDPYRVGTGVKKSCVSVLPGFPYLSTVKNLPQGVRLMYRMEGRQLNIKQFRAKSKIASRPITVQRYADSNALVA